MANDKSITQPLPEIKDSDIDRFTAKIDTSPGQGPEGDCQEWMGAKSHNGYGQFWLKHRMYTATRIAYFLQHVADPFPYLVLHTCDNSSCVNPAHLFKGTQDDNMKDAKTKKRFPTGKNHFSKKHPELCLKGEDHGRAKHSTKEILEMRLACQTNPDVSKREMARRFGLSWSTFQAIISGVTWKHMQSE